MTGSEYCEKMVQHKYLTNRSIYARECAK